MKVLAIYGSSREDGNSELLTDLVVEGCECSKIYLRHNHVKPIDDRRHVEGGFQPVDDDYDDMISQVLAHDVIVFATPIYWYGMSGLMKNFVDRFSQSLRDKRYNFKEELSRKQAYVVVTGGDQPRIKGLPLIQQFHYIFDFLSLDFGGYIIGEGNKPRDILEDERALFEAKTLNQKLRGNG